MTETVTNEDRDRRALELYEKVLEIEQRLIPTGLHVSSGARPVMRNSWIS